MKTTLVVAASLLAAFSGGIAQADSGGAIVPVTLANTFPANDDGSTAAVNLGIGGDSGINFFGQNFTQVYVNNNGNLTFNCAFGTFTPNAFSTGISACGDSISNPIIAPFFADVDTAAGGSPVTYGNATINGFNAFVVNYVNVAYFASDDKLNSFQVALIDRSDTGAGNFDIEFNYNQVQWETGSASDGSDGLGGTSAAVGYSNGLTCAGNVYYQLPGSLVNGALIDGGPNSLVTNSLNSSVPGRYIFQVRNGSVMNGQSVTNSALGTFAVGSTISINVPIPGCSGSYTITPTGALPPTTTFANNTLTGTLTAPGNYTVPVTVTDSSQASERASFSISVTSSGAPPPLSLSANTDLGTIPLGSSISAGFSISGGTPPYTVSSVGATPPGVFVTSSGISGTPTAPGNYSVTAQVTDSTGMGGSIAFSYSVFGFTGTSLPQGVIGAPYSASVGIAGGNPPYSFIYSGLPAGLNANSSGGIYGLIKSALTATVTVTATEGSGVSVSAPLQLVFAAPAPITVPAMTLPAGAVATTYSQAFSASGGAPPYTWSLSSGSIPQGLTVRPGGTITGIPAQAGTFSFAVRATDYTGASAVGAVSLTIAAPALTISPSSGALATGMASVEYPGQIVTATGGTGPCQFSVTTGTLPTGVSISPQGLISGTPTAPGTFAFTVTATDSTGVTATAQYTLTVRSFTTDLLLSTNALSFSLAAGSSSLPPSQQVTVQSTSVTIPLNYSVSITPATPWFTVTPAGGTTPGAFTVSLSSAALALAGAATPYTGTIAVACLSPAPCAGNSQQVSVSLNVTNPPPVLNISTSLVSSSVPLTSPQPGTQPVILQNAGGGSIGFQSVSCSASWCSVSAPPGSIGPGGSAPLNVTTDPTGLAAGYYRAVVTVTSSVGVYTVPVTLFVAGASTVALEPAGAQFQVSPGGTPSGSLTSFLINVASDTAVSYTASVSPNANWLTLGNSAGTASSSQPGTVTYGFNIAAIAALTPQAYYATITVTIPGSADSPQSFEVVLNVLPASAPQRPLPSPAGLLFITSAASAPAPQTVSVATTSTAPVAYQLSTTTSSGGNWLTATPALGNATPGSPATAQVSVNPANLQPGVYYGGVNYAFAGAAVRTVNVTLLVTAAATTAHDLNSKAAACTPANLVPAQTGLVGNFAAPVAWPTPLSIQLIDDCGNFITNGQIVATFTNGDPPLVLNLADPRSGYYAATWTPRNASPQVSISARASAPGLPTVSARIAGAVTPNAAPVLSPHSTLQIFNPQVGAALAPGTLVQISGSGLAVANATAPAGATLPTVLNGTQVILGGVPIPLQSVTPTLLTAEVPFELTSGMQYQIIVSANGALTTPDSLQLSNTSPGVSTGTAGVLTAYHLSGTAVSESAPASPGETLFLLAAGLGATDANVPDGSLSPAAPLANALDVPSLTINNEQAAILFAGLEPGAVGIYQVNFTVPADAPSGDLTLVLSQDGTPSNSAVLPVKAGP